MKLPSFFKKMTPFKRKPAPRQRVIRASAAARRGAQAYDDYDDDGEPTTRLSSAFVIVLLLHLVAVGGIYAFNGIKAHRKSQELMAGPGTTSPSPRAAAVPAAQAREDAAYLSGATPAPLPLAASTNSAPVRQQSNAAAPVSGARVYHVKPGDTLSKISMAYGVSSTDLANANGLKESAMLHPNQTLNIPTATHTNPVASRSPAAAATTTAANNTAADPKKSEFLKAFNANAGSTAKTHTVAKGETATSIAKKYGVSQDELLKLNSVSDPKKLQIGQTLKLPSKSSKTLAESAG